MFSEKNIDNKGSFISVGFVAYAFVCVDKNQNIPQEYCLGCPQFYLVVLYLIRKMKATMVEYSSALILDQHIVNLMNYIKPTIC